MLLSSGLHDLATVFTRIVVAVTHPSLTLAVRTSDLDVLTETDHCRPSLRLGDFGSVALILVYFLQIAKLGPVYHLIQHGNEIRAIVNMPSCLPSNRLDGEYVLAVGGNSSISETFRA
jgi:hypothetical protein